MSKRIIFLAIFIASNWVIAGETGKLVGKITDGSTGEPLIGVNIIVKGTALGAASDEIGDFMILNIPANTYTISASYIGYKTTNVTDVRVNADRTTTVNFTLDLSVVEGDEVIVEAERAVIVRDQTATTTTIEEEDFENMPINSYADILDNVAGVIDNDNGGGDDGVHIRGGRSGETAYLVDGFYVKDIISGGMATDVARGGISELSIITGAFNAEYGQAMSGIINIITQEGGAEYDVEFRASTDKLYNSWDSGRLEGTVSGPVIPTMPNLATFFISADRHRTNGRYKYLKLPWDVLKVDEDGDGQYDAGESWTDVANGVYDYGEAFTDANGNDMWDRAVYDTSGNVITEAESWNDVANGVYDVGEDFDDENGDGVRNGDVYAVADITGDGIAEPLKKGAKEISATYNWTDRVLGKLVLRPIDNLKITLGWNNQSKENRGFSMNYRQIQDRGAVNWQESNLMYGKLNYTFSENMFATVKFSQYSVENWSGPKVPGEDFLNSNHELYSKQFNIPDNWENSILDPGAEFNWLSYYAEPYNDVDQDGAFTPGTDEYEDLNEDGDYSWGVFTNLREGDAYDNTSNYEFYGSYPIVNNIGDTVRFGHSTYHNYSNDRFKTTQFEGSITWQVDKTHQVKAGYVNKKHDLFNFNGSSIGGGYFGTSSDPSFILWEKQPEEQSFFVQDKMEFSDLVVNLGLRYDMLDPKSVYADPTLNLGYRYDGNVYETSDLNSIPFEAFDAGQVEWGYINDDESFSPPNKATVKKFWSPRVGIGYPVTENTAFHFNYGQFIKYPDYNYMYDYSNSNGIGGEGVPSSISNVFSGNGDAFATLMGNSMYPFPFNLGDWYIPPVGSPNIKPERSVQYEFGLRTLLTPEYLLTLTLFYNDRYDYITASIYDADPTEYAIYENMDYANSKGFEVGMRKLFTNNFSWEIFYSYSRAEGNTANEMSHWYESYYSSVYGTHPVHRTITMAWDQPHTLNLKLDYRHPVGYGVNVLGNIGSGLPYTPTDARGRNIDDENSGRMPYTATFDAKAFYDISLRNMANVRIYMDITNLFDRKNILNVFNNTGEPDESLNPNNSPMYIFRPYYYSAPRHIELGISVGLR